MRGNSGAWFVEPIHARDLRENSIGPSFRDLDLRHMDDRLTRLRQWLTPNYLHRALAVPEHVLLKPGWRLYVLKIDGLTRQLTGPRTRVLAFEQLRTRLFPQILLRLDFTDVVDITQDGHQLWLSEAATVRWRNAAPNPASTIAFAFQYLPFAIALDGECLSGGWIVPAQSRAIGAAPRMRLLVGSRQLTIEFVADGNDDPARAMIASRNG